MSKEAGAAEGSLLFLEVLVGTERRSTVLGEGVLRLGEAKGYSEYRVQSISGLGIKDRGDWWWVVLSPQETPGVGFLMWAGLLSGALLLCRESEPHCLLVLSAMSSLTGSSQQYLGQEEYYSEQYSHGQGATEPMTQQYYPDGDAQRARAPGQGSSET
jgi:hypothetical protein